MIHIRRRIILAACIAGFVFALPAFASAATLYFSPTSGSYSVGESFPVTIFVSSPNQAMNAASGVVSFPGDALEVVSLSKSGSIFSLWVQEPSFSNSLGTVSFEGVVLNPGFTGGAGKIMTIHFRARQAGSAAISFKSGQVLANDGKGTNILGGLGDANFGFDEVQSEVPAPEEPAPSLGPPKPRISSPTHPDQNKWYAKDAAILNWQVPGGVTAVRLGVGNSPTGSPTVTYAPATSTKEVSNLGDGVWYFHAQFRDSQGWGPVAHYRFQIDTKAPNEFDVSFAEGGDSDNPQPVALFNTTDSLSGIDFYNVKIGDGDFFIVSLEDVKRNPYTLPLQAPGKRTLVVRAYDKAGNYTSDVAEFVVLGLQPPEFTEYPSKVTAGDIVVIRGKTYPRAEVTLWAQRAGGNPKPLIAKSDEEGKVAFFFDDTKESDSYRFWAEVVDGRGARSLKNDSITVLVAKSARDQAFAWAGGVLGGMLALALLSIVVRRWARAGRSGKRVARHAHEAGHAVHKAFDVLKDAMQEQIRSLDRAKTKQQLSEREEKAIRELKREAEEVEKLVAEEIEEISEETKDS